MQGHVDEVIKLADSMGDTLLVGGFSVGGALAVEHYLDSAGNEVNNIDGLMLFSGALALSDNAESMSRIWGIKLLARIIDGTYQTHGPNPYKYPNGRFGLELMDLITSFGTKSRKDSKLKCRYLPLILADVTTPILGIEQLMDASKGPNTFSLSMNRTGCAMQI